MNVRVNPSPAPTTRSKLSTSFVKTIPNMVHVELIKKELTKHIKNEMSQTFKDTIQSIIKQDPSHSVISGNSYCSVQPTKSNTRKSPNREIQKANNSQILFPEKERYDPKSAQVLSKTSAWNKVLSITPSHSKSQIRTVRVTKESKIEPRTLSVFEKKPSPRSTYQPRKTYQTQPSLRVQVNSNNITQIHESVAPKEVAHTNISSICEIQPPRKETKNSEQLISDFLQAFNQLKEGLGDDNISKEIKGVLSKLNSRDSTNEMNEIGASSFEDFLSLRHVEKFSEKKNQQVENLPAKSISELLSTREIKLAEYNSAEKIEAIEQCSFKSDYDEVVTDKESANKFNRITNDQTQCAPRENPENISEDQKYEMLKKSGFLFTFERKNNGVRESEDFKFSNTPSF